MSNLPSRMRVTLSLAWLRCLAPAVRLPPAKLGPQTFSFLTKGNCLEELLSCSVLLIPGITAVTSIVTICSKTDTLVPLKCSNCKDLLSLFFFFFFPPFKTFSKQDRELEAEVLNKPSGAIVLEVHLQILLLTV